MHIYVYVYRYIYIVYMYTYIWVCVNPSWVPDPFPAMPSRRKSFAYPGLTLRIRQAGS